MRAVSISDIASYLDLSRNTVSKVINGRGFVAEETKKRVVQAAITLGYKKLDQELVTQYGELVQSNNLMKNIMIVAVTPHFSLYWGHMIKGVTEKLREKGYNCTYHFLTTDKETFKISQDMKQQGIDGMIVMNVYHKDTIHHIASLGIPTVYFDMPASYDYADVKGDVVVCESRSSIYQITEGMIKQGKRRFGFVGDKTYCKSIYERWRGFVRALEDYQLPLQPQYCLTQSPKGHYYIDDEVEEALGRLLQECGELPEAWVCANDAIAMRVMRYLCRKGYRIPEDMMISGFDDLPDTSPNEKSLTSVYINSEEIGMRLAEQMIWRLAHLDRHFEAVKIYGEIKYRSSTGYKERN